jgi:uncharacterized membrane protein HdeD (DUF308 family)
MTTLDETFSPRSVADILTQKWWAVAWRGAFALMFGVPVFFWPDISLLTQLSQLTPIIAVFSGHRPL